MTSIDRTAARRSEAARLTALALDMLDKDAEQIVRDYLSHALAALERLDEAESASSTGTTPE